MRFVWRLHEWRLNRRKRRKHRLLKKAERAVEKFPTIRRSKRHGLDGTLIVTLTSYPPRFPTLAATLKGLLDQKVRPDHTILWLAEKDIADLPQDVVALTAYGLEIRKCHDTRSYKKLIPALEAYPGSWFVTADDDVYYPPTWLKNLVSEALLQKRPAVVAYRAHLAHIDDRGHLFPYRQWDKDTGHRRNNSRQTRIFPTGVGGILYPPNAFSDLVTDKQKFMQLCPHGDDIWFFWMARLAGTDQISASCGFDITTWPMSQDVALFHENTYKDRNDVQINSMQTEFGPVP